MHANSRLPRRRAVVPHFATEARQVSGGLQIQRRLLRGLSALGCWVALVLGLSPGVQAQPFNAATYNLRLNVASDGPNAWPHRRDAVRALIRYHEIDLLGTQEGLTDQIEDLAEMPGLARVGVGRDDGQRGGEHAAIFFRTERFALLATGDFWLSPTPEVPSKGWDARCCKRLASWARLSDRANGREFFAFSVHFDHEGVVARRESAQLMLRQMRGRGGAAALGRGPVEGAERRSSDAQRGSPSRGARVAAPPEPPQPRQRRRA